MRRASARSATFAAASRRRRVGFRDFLSGKADFGVLTCVAPRLRFRGADAGGMNETEAEPLSNGAQPRRRSSSKTGWRARRSSGLGARAGTPHPHRGHQQREKRKARIGRAQSCTDTTTAAAARGHGRRRRSIQDLNDQRLLGVPTGEIRHAQGDGVGSHRRGRRRPAERTGPVRARAQREPAGERGAVRLKTPPSGSLVRMKSVKGGPT